MASRKNCLSLIGGAAACLLVLTPNAFAKPSGGGRQATVDCGDGVITYSPSTIWPPNHKMKPIGISFAETETTDGDTLGLQVTNITSNQQTEDDAGGAGCGKPTATQGADFIFDNTPVTGTAGDDVDPVTTSVQVRAERCAKDKSGPRVYTIDVTCTDEGATDDVQLFVTVSHDNRHGH
jgi:hypothetical protein